MSKVLIAGGTGLIGNAITEVLLAKNHEIAYLSRKEDLGASIPKYKWDFKENYIDPKALEGVDYIINLAGAPVADKPWTKKRRELIINSRTQGNHLIASYIKSEDLKLKKYISASAIGYYGDRGSERLTESSSSGDGFLAECCMAWEAAIKSIEATGTATAIIRVGLVLSNEGGAFEKMMMTAKFGLGAYFGSGEQMYSWIHINDIARMFVWAMENESVQGVYNGTSNDPLKNKELIKKIMKIKGGINLPVPAFLLRTGMGELSTAILNSSAVYPEKVLKQGFKFNYPRIEEALEELLDN